MRDSENWFKVNITTYIYKVKSFVACTINYPYILHVIRTVHCTQSMFDMAMHLKDDIFSTIFVG
jgi:hypothetical protein